MKVLRNLKLIMASFAISISFTHVSGHEHHPNNLDIADFVRKFNLAKNQSTTSTTNGMVLVSFSMKKESLQRLIKQTSKVSMPLVLRGLVDNSAKATLRKIYEVDPKGKAKWSIDPRIYRTYSVSAVPAFILTKADQHVLIRGDVSLDYALHQMSKTKQKPLALKANRLLRKLQKK